MANLGLSELATGSRQNADHKNSNPTAGTGVKPVGKYRPVSKFNGSRSGMEPGAGKGGKEGC